MRSFVEIRPSQNREITLLFTDIGKGYPSRECLSSQICLLTLFAIINLSRKNPNLQQLTNNYTRSIVLERTAAAATGGGVGWNLNSSFINNNC